MSNTGEVTSTAAVEVVSVLRSNSGAGDSTTSSFFGFFLERPALLPDKEEVAMFDATALFPPTPPPIVDMGSFSSTTIGVICVSQSGNALEEEEEEDEYREAGAALAKTNEPLKFVKVTLTLLPPSSSNMKYFPTSPTSRSTSTDTP